MSWKRTSQKMVAAIDGADASQVTNGQPVEDIADAFVQEFVVDAPVLTEGRAEARGCAAPEVGQGFSDRQRRSDDRVDLSWPQARQGESRRVLDGLASERQRVCL